MNAQSIASFLRTLCGGIALGLTYDIVVLCVFRDLRRFASLLFWAVSLVIIIVCLQAASSFDLRWYHFAGLLGGWFFYHTLAGKGVKILCNLIYCFIERITQGLLSFFGKKAEKYVLKRKNTLAKLKIYADGIKKMPEKFKNDYNRYVKYFFKGKKQ